MNTTKISISNGHHRMLIHLLDNGKQLSYKVVENIDKGDLESVQTKTGFVYACNHMLSIFEGSEKPVDENPVTVEVE